MNLQVVYCNHQTAELDIRERLAFATSDQLSNAYEYLRSHFPQTELVLLSTCNRVELYTAQESQDDAPSHQDIAHFFSDFHEIPLTDFFDDLLERTGPDAVRHLFQVVSSVDSMVLGEPQIVSQVKEAYRTATEYEACGPLTHALFQGAIRVSSRVRTETGLTEGRVSIASVAVGEFGKSIFDRFDDKTVLVIGAGEMAEETLRYLSNEGVRRINIVNRSPDRARALAERWPGAQVHAYEKLEELLVGADVIVSTTGSEKPIVSVGQFSRIRRNHLDKPVFILDLGAPRDFEPGIGQIDDGVFLYDIDDLETTCEQNRIARGTEVERALEIIDDETDRFMREIYHRATGPIVKRLREQWHDISQTEVRSLKSKLGHLGNDDLKAIERSMERLVNKLLHPPLEALKDEAREGTPHGLLDALKRLFHIKD